MIVVVIWPIGKAERKVCSYYMLIQSRYKHFCRPLSPLILFTISPYIAPLFHGAFLTPVQAMKGLPDAR